MKTVLVLGGTGMLGHRVVRTLQPRFTCWFTSRNAELSARVCPGSPSVPIADVAVWPDVEQVLERLSPDVIVNCVGVTIRKLSAGQGIAAVELNSLLPRRLADWCLRRGRRLFHISTDCVFSGAQGGYGEDSIPDAADLYGRSKALGEVEGTGIVTLRGSIVGRELRQPGTELFEWCIAQRGKSIKGYRRAMYSGVTTNYLAHLIARMIEEQPDMSGLYQVAGEPISKFELLQKLNQALSLEIDIGADDSYVSDKTLKADKLQALLNAPPPGWDEMLRNMVSESEPSVVIP